MFWKKKKEEDNPYKGMVSPHEQALNIRFPENKEPEILRCSFCGVKDKEVKKHSCVHIGTGDIPPPSHKECVPAYTYKIGFYYLPEEFKLAYNAIVNLYQGKARYRDMMIKWYKHYTIYADRLKKNNDRRDRTLIRKCFEKHKLR